MPSIKVSEELHKRLKGAADAHYRSIGGEIEFMMDFIGGRNGAREDVAGYGVWIPDNHPANKQPKESKLALEGVLENPSSSQPEQTSSKLPRDKELIKQINEISDIIEQADETNQDPDYWAYMNELREEVKGLWKEWHDVTGR